MLEAFGDLRLVGELETCVAHGWVGRVTRMKEDGAMVGGIRPCECDAIYRVMMRGDSVALGRVDWENIWVPSGTHVMVE